MSDEVFGRKPRRLSTARLIVQAVVPRPRLQRCPASEARVGVQPPRSVPEHISDERLASADL